MHPFISDGHPFVYSVPNREIGQLATLQLYESFSATAIRTSATAIRTFQMLYVSNKRLSKNDFGPIEKLIPWTDRRVVTPSQEAVKRIKPTGFRKR